MTVAFHRQKQTSSWQIFSFDRKHPLFLLVDKQQLRWIVNTFLAFLRYRPVAFSFPYRLQIRCFNTQSNIYNPNWLHGSIFSFFLPSLSPPPYLAWGERTVRCRQRRTNTWRRSQIASMLVLSPCSQLYRYHPMSNALSSLASGKP